jgi:hypothetical protein
VDGFYGCFSVNDKATNATLDVEVLYHKQIDFAKFVVEYGKFQRDQALAVVRFWEAVLGMEPTKTARELKREERENGGNE